MEIEDSTLKYYEKSKERHYLHPVIQAFAYPKYKWITQNIDITNKTILDVGSGNGYMAQFLRKDSQLTVLDQSMNQLKSNPAENQVVGSAYKIPFDDEKFDIVFCSNLLHHLENPVLAIREMKRVSKKRLIFIEPNRKNPLIILGAMLTKRERGAMNFSKKYLLDLSRKAGLLLEKHTYIGGSVMPNVTPTFLLPFTFPYSQRSLSFFQIVSLIK